MIVESQRKKGSMCFGSEVERRTPSERFPLKTHKMISCAKAELWHRLPTHCSPFCFLEAEWFSDNARSDWPFAVRNGVVVP